MTENQEIQMHMKPSDEATLSEVQQQTINKLASKHYKKNKKEIDRLTSHSRECLIQCNEDGYKYAITKLRNICQQKPLDSETLHSLWITSKTQTDKIILDAVKMQEQQLQQETGKTVPVCSV
ncbi:hypothetical protein HPMBJEAJ_00276 [Aeromonas phage avDM6]|nr:hypothetical protein HPMBJEAJ_00276 [Aeromonas phage avDM6]